MPSPPSAHDPGTKEQQNDENAVGDRETSISPAPPPPVAQTPGPRASRFQQVYSEALMRTVRANSYANFAACFPTPAHHAPRSLESVWRQLNTKLEDSARKEFAEVVEEREVVRMLNELDRLVGEAKLRKENGEADEESVPPHTLGANELYDAHLAPYLAQTQSSLDLKLDTVQNENIQLGENVEAQRSEIRQLLSKLDAVVGDVSGAVNAMRDFDSEGKLRNDAQHVDEEVIASQER